MPGEWLRWDYCLQKRDLDVVHSWRAKVGHFWRASRSELGQNRFQDVTHSSLGARLEHSFSSRFWPIDIGCAKRKTPAHASTIVIFFCNVLFLGNVGQNVCAILPKLRGDLPSPGGNLQILPLQFSRWQDDFSGAACATKGSAQDCAGPTGYPDGSCIVGDERPSLLACSRTFCRPRTPSFLSHEDLLDLFEMVDVVPGNHFYDALDGFFAALGVEAVVLPLLGLEHFV